MLALIDADILVYRVGFASNDTTEKLACRRADKFVEELVMRDGIDEYEGYLTGGGNYRNEIATIQPYKGNRVLEKPVHYQAIRDFFVRSWKFEIIEGQEADDMLGIRAYEMEPDEYEIHTLDKDLNMIRGKHYNFAKNEEYVVEEIDTMYNFYMQTLVGDKVDNIPGIRGIGPVKAEKILGDTRDTLELHKRVVEAYKGDTDRLLEVGRLLWIRRKPDEMWSFPDESKLSESEGS